MALNRYYNTNDNPDLTEERGKCTFNTDELSYVVWESKKEALRRREISAKVDMFPELHDKCPTSFLTREQKMEEAARKVTRMFSLMDKLGIDRTNGLEVFHLTNEVIGIEGHPFALHFVMFLPAIQAQADDEQLDWWLSRAMRLEIIGTYAQTELGHGTNLKKLETTAVYDKKTKEFVLNTPHTTSIKWWPGNLGKVTNHAIVTAILLIDGKNYGPHNFFVQLRSEETHLPMKGITVGDIGPKMEYNATDNGFLRLDNVRIPRRHMLMRHSKVLEDGTYIAPQHTKAAYSAMIHVRSHMIVHQAIFLAYSLTTAIRYSCVRRQGNIEPQDKKEVRILDYQTQQHRLLPQVARTFAILFSGQQARKLYIRVAENMKAHGTAADLADLHAITSGLKAVVTFMTGQGIEQARMACGGHGYSMASYISAIYGVAIGGCTYEGENMVMLLQLARYLMKAAESARKQEKLPNLVSYLAVPSQKFSLIDRKASNDYKEYLNAFDHVARRQIFKSYDRLQKIIATGVSREVAWNENSVELQRAARSHTRAFMAHAFHNSIENVTNFEVRKVLEQLFQLHLNYELIDMGSYLVEDGYMNSGQLDHMKENLYKLLAAIRPNAVSIMDSWDFTDRELRSVLGRQDGHVYENLLKWAQQSDLNKTEVLPVVTKYLKPIMEKAKLLSKL
ncbi:unnamed protein product [Auanema sp. JU1783]|nr:unnamed protein product [Auanema sp. JU1783]